MKASSSAAPKATPGAVSSSSTCSSTRKSTRTGSRRSRTCWDRSASRTTSPSRSRTAPARIHKPRRGTGSTRSASDRRNSGCSGRGPFPCRRTGSVRRPWRALSQESRRPRERLLPPGRRRIRRASRSAPRHVSSRPELDPRFLGKLLQVLLDQLALLLFVHLGGEEPAGGFDGQIDHLRAQLGHRGAALLLDRRAGLLEQLLGLLARLLHQLGLGGGDLLLVLAHHVGRLGARPLQRRAHLRRGRLGLGPLVLAGLARVGDALLW